MSDLDARVARLGATIAVEAILAQIPDVAVEPGFMSTFEDSFILRGMRSLPFTFDRNVTSNR